MQKNGESRAIVFVCMANVCRSPLMAASFAECLRAGGTEESWSIASGGTDVSRELEMCEVAASLVSDDPAGRAFREDHRSRPVRAESLAGVQLVIAASREERGLLARLDPAQRSRTFTLQEAVLLGSHSLGALEKEHALAAVGASEPLRAYAYALNLRRSRAQLFGPAARFPALSELAHRVTGRANTHPLDVPDAHHLSARQHLRGLRELRDTVRTLHGQIDCFLNTSA